MELLRELSEFAQLGAESGPFKRKAEKFGNESTAQTLTKVTPEATNLQKSNASGTIEMELSIDNNIVPIKNLPSSDPTAKVKHPKVPDLLDWVEAGRPTSGLVAGHAATCEQCNQLAELATQSYLACVTPKRSLTASLGLKLAAAATLLAVTTVGFHSFSNIARDQGLELAQESMVADGFENPSSGLIFVNVPATEHSPPVDLLAKIDFEGPIVSHTSIHNN